jgi:hypothetical protein
MVNNVTCKLIARQRLGKHIPAGANGIESRTSIARQRNCKQAFPTIKMLCFLRGPCKMVIRESSEAGRSSSEVKSRVSRRQSTGIWAWEQRNWFGSCRIMATNELDSAKKTSRVLQWPWDFYKSVARKRLVKTENPSACATVNCKVCKSAIALCCL